MKGGQRSCGEVPWGTQGSWGRKKTPVPSRVSRAGQAGPACRMKRVDGTRVKKKNSRILYFYYILFCSPSSRQGEGESVHTHHAH